MGDFVWVFIPITALLIPIVAMLTVHQQKMAQILNQGATPPGDLNALRQDIAELKTLVRQQSIALDTLADNQKSLNAPPPATGLSERLGTQL